MTVRVFDQGGDSSVDTDVNVPAGTGVDVELVATLGLPLAADTVGLVKVIPDADDAVRVEGARIKLNTNDPSEVDIGKALPFR